MESREKLLTRINTIPTIPTVYAALSTAIEDPLATNNKLAKIISSDQASSFKILKIANSSFYGFRVKIETISQAIFHIGFNEVKNIVFALSIMNLFSKNKRLPNYSPLDLWAHSIAVGIVTRLTGEGIGETNLENYFLAGIVHDIGKIILLEYEYNEYANVLKLTESGKYSMREAEMEVFGFDHTQIGFELAKKWKLSLTVQETILHHHNVVSGKTNDSLINSVYLANKIVRMLRLGFAGDRDLTQPDINIWDKLNIPEGYFTSIGDKIVKAYNQTISVMLAE